LVTIQPDPANPDRLILTQTVQVFLDKVLLKALNEELEQIISAKAREDFKKPQVQKELRRLATNYLAKILGIEGPKAQENK
jgi:hypothetical protein